MPQILCSLFFYKKLFTDEKIYLCFRDFLKIRVKVFLLMLFFTKLLTRFNPTKHKNLFALRCGFFMQTIFLQRFYKAVFI